MKILSSKSVGIHPSATVHPSAIVGDDVEIGPHSEIYPYAVVGDGTRLGAHCVVYPFAHVGSAPQMRDMSGGRGKLIVGDHNRFFQGATISLGCNDHEGVTRIGHHNLFMAYSHVGHDCQLGNGITIANHTSIAGHVEIGDWVTIGGYVGLHQFVRVGDYSFVAANAMVSQDVPPFGIAAGDRAKLIGLNRKGISRAEMSAEDAKMARQAFRHFFHRYEGKNVVPTQSEKWVNRFQEFPEGSNRGALKRHKAPPKVDPG